MPRLIPMGLYRRFVHPLVKRRASPRARQALRRSEVYFPYFSLGVRFDDARARALLDREGIRPVSMTTHFDAMIDFSKVVNDPADADLIFPAFNCGDGIHPSARGYFEMGSAVDLSVLRKR